MDEKLFVHKDDHVLYSTENFCLYSRGAIGPTEANERSQHVYARRLGTFLRNVVKPDRSLEDTLSRRLYRFRRVSNGEGGVAVKECTDPSSVRDDSHTSESTIDWRFAGTSVDAIPLTSCRSSGCSSVVCSVRPV